jgi:hypothetical protein
LHTYDLAQTAELIEAMRGTRLFFPVLLAVLAGCAEADRCASLEEYRLDDRTDRGGPERIAD